MGRGLHERRQSTSIPRVMRSTTVLLVGLGLLNGTLLEVGPVNIQIEKTLFMQFVTYMVFPKSSPPPPLKLLGIFSICLSRFA